MRMILVHSFALVLAIAAALLVPDLPPARAASSVGPLPTVEGPTVGRMRRIIIPAEGTPVPAVRPNNKANPPANSQSQAPVRSNPGPAQVPVQPLIDRAIRAGARGAVAPLPLQ
jgi:hypothetical protein